jgi:hypothetical protein
MPNSEYAISLLIVYVWFSNPGKVALFTVQNCPCAGAPIPTTFVRSGQKAERKMDHKAETQTSG